MTGLDKILKQIEDDASSHAEDIIAKADKEAGRILDGARKEGEEKVQEIGEKSKSDVNACLSRGESSALLQEKKLMLSTKREMIEDIIRKAKESLYQLSEEAYFETIVKMIKKHALDQPGEILFSFADKSRLPAQLELKIKEALSDKKGAELKISDDTRELDGGFVLIYGDIEENCSFDALFFAEKEALQDKVYAVLFE